MKRLLLFVLLLCPLIQTAAREVSFAELRTMVRPGGELILSGELELEGVVISEPKHPNLAQGEQRTFRNNSSTQNDRTAYLESPAEGLGAKLVFQHFDPEAARALRYARLTLSLKGAVLKMTARGALSLEDLPNGSILSVQEGTAADLPLRHKALGELKAEDLHTWVSIPDCEYVFKDGAYVNILESYARSNPDNKQYRPLGYMDTWQGLLCDGQASPLYVVINARTPWRRTGKGVPQGKGVISGILVDEDNVRYGSVRGWQIRPLEESDIAFDWNGPSSFKTLAEWNWNDGEKTFNTTEGPVERFRSEKMLPEVGKGELTLEGTTSTYRGLDCNNPVLEPAKAEIRGAKGLVRQGAMEIRAQVPNWWNWGDDCGNAVVLKCSTKNLKAEKLFLAFSFAAGANKASCSRLNPAWWGVEVSTDNVNIARMDIPDIRLHTLPWWESTMEGVTYTTSMEAGMGMTEHLVELPASLIGQETVYVRILPTRKVLMTLAEQGSANAALRQNMDYWSVVSFGTITLRYR